MPVLVCPGASFRGHASAIDAAHSYLVANNQIGNLAIDTRTHLVYAAFNGIANESEAVCSAIGTWLIRGIHT